MTFTSSQTIQSSLVDSNEITFPHGEFWSNEPPLESNLHLRQIILLIQCLEWLWQDRNDFFAAGNLTIYYSPNQKKSEYFRGPDFFVVLGTERKLERKSWVVWQEGGKYPNLIIEILSDSTAHIDKEEKKQIYQDIFRTPNYFWFDPDSLELAGFRLMEGQYQPIEPTEQGWLWSQELGLYLGIYDKQLRYFTSEGQLVLTPEETAKLSQQQLETERQQLALVQQELAQMKAQMKALEVEPK
ncbi:Uma2 family endonuclease [Aphanothece sacrum]|uniref:Putative restriction endonuclease domain-containing protein n=1 Tax=Aphanothece sacrum FPU1 TaxID=1920663 RepID=A0A401IH87_APHSA|nr:Uma2 family endonuclease [Aphanothece sacrum]GBF80665.1 hypothetical protein AsFPU1_2069 [Aphanothece sacrum FPU1]GBF83159.1 hypothetical protein AsFPU3_0198 [Aphanothece sacrum FPU3]